MQWRQDAVADPSCVHWCQLGLQLVQAGYAMGNGLKLSLNQTKPM
jgi:hypothetical protein